jgi:hypothetical protein
LPLPGFYRCWPIGPADSDSLPLGRFDERALLQGGFSETVVQARWRMKSVTVCPWPSPLGSPQAELPGKPRILATPFFYRLFPKSFSLPCPPGQGSFSQKVHQESDFPQHGRAIPTHCILAILLDDIEMLRDRFMGKQEAQPKVGDGFRCVVGTGAWQKLKETAAE